MSLTYSFIEKQIGTRFQDRITELEISEDPVYVGVLSELLKRHEKLNLAPGTWKLTDYYDHSWALFGTYSDYRNQDLTFHRLTDWDIQYGLITESELQELEQNFVPEDYDDFRYFVEESVETLYFGRGEAPHHVYLASENGKVVAFLIADESFLNL